MRRLLLVSTAAVTLAASILVARQTIPLSRADVNHDCSIDRADATLVQSKLGRRVGQSGYSADADVNQDGVINNTDLTFVSRNAGKQPCPPVNRPPVITSTAITAATLLSPYAYQVTAGDADLDPVTFSLQTAPPGMTIDATSGVVRWMPPTTGALDVVIHAADGRGGSTTQAYVLTITRAANRPPQFSPVADRQVRVGTSLKLTLGAHDPDPGDTVAFSLAAGPSKLSVAGGVVTFVPDLGDIGPHPVSVVVTDAAGATDTASFTIHVTPATGPPVFGPIADVTIPAEAPYARQLTALDPDPGDAVSYILRSGPAGLTIDTTGQLTWTPGLQQLGPHTVKVSATDTTGGLAATSFVIFVDAPRLPQAPVAQDDRFAVRRNSTLVVASPGVLANDTDPAARSLSAQLVTSTSKGTASLGSDGALTYTPTPPLPNSTEPVLAYGVSHSDSGGILAATYTQPLVADLNGDGAPEIVFLAAGAFADRRLIGVDGATGQKTFATDVYQPTATPQVVVCLSFCELAAADLDNDRRIEILAVHSDDETTALRRRIVAFNHDGTYRWKSEDIVDGTTITQSTGLMWLTVADIDQDGATEIIGLHQGKSVATPPGVIAEDLVTVFDGQGHIRWTRRVPGRASARDLSVADIDLDGTPELVIGGAVLDADGNVEWTVKANITSIGYLAVGNLDDDPFAEIAYQDQFDNLYVYEHDGIRKWGPIRRAILSRAGPPTIGDADGDGRAEIIRGADGVEVWGRSGNFERLLALPAPHIGHGGNAVVFDLNGDGTPEVVYNGARGPFDTGFMMGALYIFDGPSGTLLHSLPATRNSAGSAAVSGPLVADVTGDGSAEIVTGGWDDRTVLRVFRAATGSWAQARPIWNQMGYHVTNVLADGRIPSHEPVHWLTPGVNVYRMNVPLPGERTSDSDSLTYTAHNGLAASNLATVRIDILPPNAVPRILSAAPGAATPGVEYVYGVHAVDPDAGETLTFTLPIAPAGMTISPQGLVRWTPGTLGAAVIAVVQVTDSQGESDAQQFTIHVTPPVVVPDVVGGSLAAADATLAAAGLRRGSSVASPSASVPAGTILSQQPSAGVTVASSAAVDLVVSSGPVPVVMPHVAGLGEFAAVQTLTAAGLTPSVSYGFSSAVPRGQVMLQNPAAGTLLAPGSVGLSVSAGPGLVLRLQRDLTTADRPIPFTVGQYDLTFAEFSAPPLVYSVTPTITPSFGTLPVISNGQVTPSIDTRGAFLLTATDPVTGRTVSARFSVTAPRTPGQASMSDAYGDVGQAIGEINALALRARTALAFGDTPALVSLLDQMVKRWQAVDTFRLLFATPFGLPQGFMPTAADLPALGLTPTADDLLAGQVLADASEDLTSWTSALREPATSMMTLESLAARFHGGASQMRGLTVSEWGGIRNAPAMTVFVSQLLPDFYDALFDELEQVVANAGGPGPSTLSEQLVTIAVKYVIDEITETPLHEFRESVMQQAAWTASAVAAAHHFKSHAGAGNVTAIVSGASLSMRVFRSPWSFVEGEFDAAQPSNAVVVLLGPDSESALAAPPDSISGALAAAANAGAVFHTLDQIYTSLKNGTASPSNALGLAATAFQAAHEGYRGCIFSSLPTCSQLVFPNGFESVYEYSPPDVFGNSFTGLPVPILVMIYDKSSGRVTIDTPVFLPTPKGS